MVNNLLADTRPAKDFLINGITKDVSVYESIFDLIDNSIDAYQKNSDNQTLDYKKYTIQLTINSEIFSIKDHGIGISSESLKSDTLRFGSKTNHFDSSIGFYGIGLNRSLFKLGNNISIFTETNKERSAIELDLTEFLKNDDDWHLPFKQEKPLKKTGTLIQVKSLHSDIVDEFIKEDWLKSLITEISHRYSEFLSKNLIITVNGVNVPNFDLSFRDEAGFKILTKTFTLNGVSVKIELGQNKNHYFSYEDGYSKENNATTKDCGWFVYCNNRAVKLFDWTNDTGWSTKVHAEHNGFIGKVYFNGNAGNLPWNTSKTGIDLNNEVYKKALVGMRSFSEAWRKHATRVIKRGFRPIVNNSLPSNDLFGPLPDIKSQQVINPNKAVLEPTPLNTIQNNQLKLDHLEDNSSSTEPNVVNSKSTINYIDFQSVEPNVAHDPLMYEIPQHGLNKNKLFEGEHPFKIPESATKLNSIVNEMSKLKIDSKTGSPYAVLFLIRSFIELSCRHYASQSDGNLKTKLNGSLAEQVDRCLDHMIANNVFSKNLDEDTRNIDAIKALCNTKKSDRTIKDIQYLQNTLHNPRLLWAKDSINSFWSAILPFLVKCYE